MQFSLHGIISLVTIALIWATGWRTFLEYRATKIPSLLLFAGMFFSGGLTFLAAIIPSFLGRADLFPLFISLGTIPLAFGVAGYFSMIAKFIPALAPLRGIIFPAMSGLGLFTALLIYQTAPTPTFIEGGWTQYHFPPLLRLFFIPFFATSMLAGATLFFVRGIKLSELNTRLKAFMNGLGFFLLAIAILLAVFEETILYNFLFLAGYILIFIKIPTKQTKNS